MLEQLFTGSASMKMTMSASRDYERRNAQQKRREADPTTGLDGRMRGKSAIGLRST